MPVNCKKAQIHWMSLFVFSLLFSTAVTACSSNVPKNENSQSVNTLAKVGAQTNEVTASPNNKNPDTNNTLTAQNPQTNRTNLRPGEQAWATLYPGQEAQGLKFTKDGALSYKGKVLLSKIPVSYGSDGTVKYAGSLIVSNPSPSGRFNFFKACEQSSGDGSGGLCWALFVVDKQKGKANKTHAGKYGPLQWVKWSKDERYALLTNQNEGATWLHAIDLQTGDSKSFNDAGWSCSNIDFNSFSWVDDRVFKIKITHPQGCEQDGGKSFVFTGNIKKLFKK